MFLDETSVINNQLEKIEAAKAARLVCLSLLSLTWSFLVLLGPSGFIKGLSIYYVSSYNKAGTFRMLTNAYLREQGFI